MLKTLLLLTSFSASLWANEPPILAAPELVEGIAWSVTTTAEWQGTIATAEFPQATRDHHGKVIQSILQTHAQSETAARHLLFTRDRKQISDANHRRLHLVFTDQPQVLLKLPETGERLGIATYRGLPLSGFSLSRDGVNKQYNFIVVWVGDCLVNHPNYSPRANAFLYTWINLAIQLNGYMDHHLSNPLALFVGDRQGVTLRGAQEKGIAAEQEFFTWLHTWEGLDKLPPSEKRWLLTATGFTRSLITSATGCPKDIGDRAKSDEN